MYKVYRLPSEYTKGIRKNVKLQTTLTQDYGYCVEDGCVNMYLRNGCNMIDKTFITLLQCHDYALFIHMQTIGVGGALLVELENRCIHDGDYFTTKSIKYEDAIYYTLKGIFDENYVGFIYITEWYTSANRMNIDARETHKNTDTDNGEIMTECIVRINDGLRRHCICVDVYLGTNMFYDIRHQHTKNINNIKSEASHKGLDMLMQAGSASEV